jgi:hypothetical protein
MLLKTKLMIGMGAVIVALGTLLFLSEQRSQTRKVSWDQAVNFNLAATDSLKTYKTDKGKLVAVVETQELTIRNLQKMQDDPRVSWIKEIEAVNKRLNNVEQVSQFTAKVVANFKIPLRDTTILVNDSTFKVRTFDNHDEWLRVSGVVTPDTIEVIPFVKVNIKSVLLWERERWPGKKFGLKIGKKNYTAHGTTDNPYATITAIEVTKIGRMKD